jgi:hypothetical protein
VVFEFVYDNTKRGARTSRFSDSSSRRRCHVSLSADPDALVLAMLSARSADSSSETAPEPMRRGKGVAKTQPPDLKVLKAS